MFSLILTNREEKGYESKFLNCQQTIIKEKIRKEINTFAMIKLETLDLQRKKLNDLNPKEKNSQTITEDI